MSKGLNPALCATCEAAIAEEVRGRVRRIHEALEVWGNGAGRSAKQEACDRIIQEAEALHIFEARGILTTAPPPSALLAHFRATREALDTFAPGA